jgi:hypothetical protein
VPVMLFQGFAMRELVVQPLNLSVGLHEYNRFSLFFLGAFFLGLFFQLEEALGIVWFLFLVFCLEEALGIVWFLFLVFCLRRFFVRTFANHSY